MKTIFNIQKNIRNSRSISVLNALKKLHCLGILLCALLFGSLQVWGADPTITITRSSFSTGGSTGYSTYTWTASTISGSATIYATNATEMQFNSSNRKVWNTTPIPGKIKSITMTTSSGTDRAWVVRGSSSAFTSSSGSSDGTAIGSSTTVTTSGTTFTVTGGGDFQYFLCYLNASNASYIASIVVTYEETASTHTVTINKNQASWGTVSASSVTDVEDNTSISAVGSVLTVGETTVTATPHAQDANYNYDFSSWTGIPAGGKVTADVTVTANFTRTERTLTNYRTSCASTFDIVLHDNNGGSHNGSATVAVNGTTLTNITPPTKSSFVVEGYYDDDSYSHKVAASDGTLQANVTGYTGAGGAWTRGSGATLYAKWTASYTVTYNANGGDGTMTDSNSPYASGSIVTVLSNSFTAPTGKEFDHWNTAENNSGASYNPSATFSISANTTLFAQWRNANYNVTYSAPSNGNYTIKVADGTATSATKTANYEQTITIAATPNSGYQFVSWTIRNTSTSADVTSTLLTGDKPTTATTTFTMPAYGVTITATFVQVYTVTFVHHDKGTYSGGSTEWIVPSNDNTITLPTVTGVSCGFYDTFEGWIASNSEYAESDDKPATVYAGSSSYTVQGNVTLRALYSYEDPDATGYTKITSGVTAGTYLISTNGGVAYTGKVDGQTYGGYTSVTVSEGVIATKGSAQEVTITLGTGANAGKFAIYDGTYYLSSPSSNNLTFNNSITYDWELSSESGKEGEIHSLGQSTRYLQYNSGSPRFACYTHSQAATYLFKKGGSKYCTNPSCVKPSGVYIVYNKNAGDATMSCSTSNRHYKNWDTDNQYPKLASAYTFCDNATRDGYTLVGWNTRADGLGTTYDIDHSYTNLPVSGDLDGDNYVTLTVYAMWAPSVKFNLGNATGGTGVPAVVEEDGGFMLPEPTAAQIGTIPCGYSFYGWSESSVAATSTKPTLYMPGTKYTGSYRTLYAVYRLAGEGSGDLYYFTFEVSSKTYCITAKHGSYDRFVVEETTSGLEFGLDNGYLYYMENDAKVYVYWAGSGTTVTTTSTMPNNNAYKTTFVPGANGTTVVTPATSERYLQFTGTGMYGDYYDRAYYTTGGTNPTLVEATSYTYATNPSCETTATLQFVINGTGGTFNYPDGYNASSYEDLTPGTDVYLPTANYPGEWVFEGWMKGAPLPSQDHSPEGMSNFYKVTLNTTTYEATPAGTTTFYAVFSKTNNDKQFDPVNGGTYKIFGIKSDATKVYMPVWGGSTSTVAGVTDCELTGEYTITPGTGDYAGQYKITHVNGNNTYTLGVEGDGSGQTGLKNVADAWWDIEASSSTKGTWRMKIHGSSNRVLSLSSNTFGNYAVSQVNNPSQTTYRDMEIGECIYTEYTSTPENIPYITITGSPVKITSTKDERVYAPTKIHIEAHNFTGTRRINFSATNGFATNPAYVNCEANGSYSGDIDIYYEPTTDGDGSIVTSVLTASQAAESVTQTFSAIKGRNLPQDFVIAVKSGEQWYALPDDCHSSGTPKAVPIEVNDPNAPTAASRVPHNTEWRLSDVVNSNNRPKDKVYFYEPNAIKTEDPLTYYNYTLYAGSAPSIQTNAQLSGVNGENSYTYEWGLSTNDLCAYTISNANVNKNISINESGNFGTHATNVVSDVLYLLPITAYYEPAKMQVLEWKANSVVVMYTGTQTTATTQVGSNSASSAQTLASQKLTHAIYELTTGQALTSNAGKALKVSFGGGAEMAILTIPIIINSDVTASESHESQDVVIVSGGKLTAAATKYSFHNIYVYGGGKLKIASGSQLGVNNIIMRAGGVTTNGSGGSATYVYTYPQVELGGTLTSTQANIKHEYITDYDHWYQLCLPFNATLSSITYPTEYYGDNVTEGNSGSWVIKRYDGATRATGEYNAWKDIEKDDPKPTTTTAGIGYIFWGAPKKVSVGGADAVRQAWGIQRMTMSVTADAATTAETDNKNISVDSYSEVATSTKPNDQGWNLVGNPYMVNLANWSSTSMIAGELVHSDTDPWDGKWKNSGDGVRYVTIPDNHFDNYVAKTTATAISDGNFMPGRAFFVQIAEGATTLTFAASNRASLMPALFARATETVDIETGIVMSDETLKDEVNFWIKDGKTAEYEYNADYPKTPNSTNFNIYGVHSHGDLSWVAISPEIAAGSMAIGYQVPAAGDFTLSLSESYVSDDIDHFFVTDHETSPEITTDLMAQDYVFHVNQAETNNIRFTVSIKLKDEDTGTTTGIDNLDVNSDVPTKFIYQDKMYILYQGIIYDATGKKVREINN